MSRFFALAFASLFFLAGCSSLPTQPNVSADAKLWQTKQKIGVYVSPIPKITTSFPGADCLLCLATASLANSSLTKQVETFKASQLEKTKETVIAMLKDKGHEVVVIDSLIKESSLPKHKSAPNKHIPKNYSTYKTKFDVDQLLVVNFYNVGVTRNYAAYVPTGAPQAIVAAKHYMIDTKTNDFSLYNPINVIRGAEGEWDKPKFPGLTNAFYQAEEAAYDQLIGALK